ncbi:MAG: DUF3126 family protein [Alphaproteobacteria bacterium]|nr:DUF3126 family protein [Alphaproteobacteria bacterium]
MKPEEVSQLQAYLARTFKSEGFALKMREKANDSVEVILNGEFVGVLYKLVDEGETSYDFNMSILDIDLKG